MTHDTPTPKVSADLTPSESGLSLPPITLTGGLDRGELDALIPGGLYVLTPVSPPSRFSLWANFLRTAVAAGRVCHVLVKADPAEFLERLQAAGWSEVQDAWTDETLRLYRMADTFSKILFRLDVDGLTTELAHWGVQQQHVLLVDAADELLSLHDLSLATPQAVKLKTWAKSVQVSVLLNFNLASSPTISNGLTGLMDHFSGVARLRSEAEGPILVLEYWQSPTGTVAERGLSLELVPEGYHLRSGTAAPVRRVTRQVDPQSLPLVAVAPAVETVASEPVVVVGPDCFTVDQVWARELQLLMGTKWKALPSISELRAAAAPSAQSVVLLRFGPDSDLAEMAREVHGLRKALGNRMRLIVAELRASLRYANELMLLRLGVDAIIRRDVSMERWPALLMNAQAGVSVRVAPEIDVESAMASAASSHVRGYLQVPDFLTEVHAALERGQVLGVPLALAVLYPASNNSLFDAVKAAEFRRPGDILTTDGEKLHVFFYACSITKGPKVLESVFRGQLFDFISSVEWMASEADIEQVLSQLEQRYQQHPMDWMASQEAVFAASVETPDLSEEPLLLARLEVGDATRVTGIESSEHAIDANAPSEAAENEAEETFALSEVSSDETVVDVQASNGAIDATTVVPVEAAHAGQETETSIEEGVSATSEDALPDFSTPQPQLRTLGEALRGPRTAKPVPLPSVEAQAGADSDSSSDVEKSSKAESEALTEIPSDLPSDVPQPDESLASQDADLAGVEEVSAERAKKMKAYRVREVGPFSPPELNLLGDRAHEFEKEPEEAFTTMPEVTEIIRRLAQAPAGTVKKANHRKDLGH